MAYTKGSQIPKHCGIKRDISCVKLKKELIE
jgi:hypothetical protein